MRDYREPEVWQLCDQLRTAVVALVARPEFRGHTRLRDQLDAAASGPCAHIAEGFGRYVPREFARFIRIARGSLLEVLEHMHTALLKKLATPAEHATICSLARRAAGACAKLARCLESATEPR